MRILIVTPQLGRVATGNRCSAEQWAGVLGGLGHEVELCAVDDEIKGRNFDLLVALNAKKARGALTAFEAANPDGRVIVVLTGTDIYPEAGELALESMWRADRLVVLQSRALAQVPLELREKSRVVVQAAPPIESEGLSENEEFFDLAVVGHFREVKDPLRTAAAARLLSKESRVRVRHAGAVLEGRYEILIREEMAENPRYEWLGELTPQEAGALIARSDLLVLTSHSEGAGRVVGEAVACGTPVISSRIDGVVGLLGEDYPGYFPVGDTEVLAELIRRTEGDAEFYGELKACCDKLAPLFSPEAESKAWQVMLDELTIEQV